MFGALLSEWRAVLLEFRVSGRQPVKYEVIGELSLKK
jgi:hypothetical protein